jgi:hypothetical protein
LVITPPRAAPIQHLACQNSSGIEAHVKLRRVNGLRHLAEAMEELLCSVFGADLRHGVAVDAHGVM